MEFLQYFFGLIYGFLYCFFMSFAPTRKSVQDAPRQKLVKTYDDYYNTQLNLDTLRGVDGWTTQDRDSSYDWQNLATHRRELERCRKFHDDRALCSHLRDQSLRNTCRILSPSLYRKSPVQTKRLIHDYLLELRRCIAYVADPNSMRSGSTVVSAHEKRQLLSDMRTILGRTTLVLQGGAIVSLSHIGVVKALHEQAILPQIITGSSSGAFIAAILCTSSPREFSQKLQGVGVSLEAFARAQAERPATALTTLLKSPFLEALRRRYLRYQKDRHFFDIQVMRDCARENLGEMTFEEAYAKTGRILNITIAMSEVAGTPQLLNYVTAPHVLIWTAVMASIATSKQMYAPAQLLCKNETGAIADYYAADFSDLLSDQQVMVHPETALQRIGEIFNVNHFIFSQTRPYVAPFVRLQAWADHYPPLGAIIRLALGEGFHWLKQFENLGILPVPLQRVLLDEKVPVPAQWGKISITPKLGLWDLCHLFDYPTVTRLQEWGFRGEQSTWPRMCELKCRCEVEMELDAAYTRVWRRVPGAMTGD